MEGKDLEGRMSLYYCPNTNCPDYNEVRTTFHYEGMQEGFGKIKGFELYTHRHNLDGTDGCGSTYGRPSLVDYMKKVNEE